MKNRLVALASMLLLATTTFSQDRGPSTPQERQQALKIIRALEADPLSRELKDARTWLTSWIASVPDISVALCGAFTGPLLGSKKNYATEIFVQSMFSAAAAVIENPEMNDDAEAKFLAGVEGSLRAYESIRKSKPKVSWPILDELIAMRDAGTLPVYVHQKAPGCQ